jgi:hypothetical protein
LRILSQGGHWFRLIPDIPEEGFRDRSRRSDDRQRGPPSTEDATPAERLSMRKVREVLPPKYACSASVRTIARSVAVGHTTVAEYLRRPTVIGITWPVPSEIDDAKLERRLFTPAGFYTAPTRAMPDWNHVHAELRRRGVTLLLLWEDAAVAAEQHVVSTPERKCIGAPE